MLAVGNIRAKEAWIHKSGRRNPIVNLLGARLPNQLNGSAAGVAANNGIVHHDHALAANRRCQGVEFNAQGLFPLFLPRFDERAGNIAVFNEAGL